MKSLIGKPVDLKNNTFYAGHWGIIKDFDGIYYHINDGSIGNKITPVFSRDEFIVRKQRKNNYVS